MTQDAEAAGAAAPAPSHASPARPRRRPGRFFVVLVGLAGAMHAFFAVAAAQLFARLGVAHAGAWGVAAAVLGVALFFNRARQVMPDRRRSDLVVRLVDIPFYVHFCAAFFALVPSLVAAVVWPLFTLATRSEVAFPSGFVLGVYLVGLGLAAYGTLFRRRAFVVERLDVPVRDLDPRLDGFRIVQLSDLHVGSLTPKPWADRWVAAANREAADLAVVTGDMVTSGVEFHDDIADALADLRAKHGTIVSMGNHDYFGEGEPLISRLRERGCIVMRNEGRTLTHDGADLYLAAVDDTWTRRANLEAALAEWPTHLPAVLLAHEPAVWDGAAPRNVALTLSGHTHGGQVAVPFFGKRASLANLSHDYTVGLYERAGAHLYVHPGLGTTGPPVRFGVAPAIAVLTLRRAR